MCAYTIGDPVLHGQLFPVCREAFRVAHQMTHSMLETLCKEIKEGDSGTTSIERNFSDRSAVEFSEDQIEMQKTVADVFGIRLSHLQKAAMHIRNSTAQLSAFGWLQHYFTCVGDEEPNTDGEVHLDPVKVKDIYTEYKDDMIMMNSDSVSAKCFEVLDRTAFGELWNKCFSHVKIREYKAVTGKCSTCAALSKVRKESKCKETRAYITTLFAYHRSLLMGERMEYHKRIEEAKINPLGILSLVSDGMAQIHCQLPWRGNIAQFPKCLPQHIQCVRLHNRHTFLYRTFHNVSNTANLQLHTFLLSLHYVIEKEGKQLIINRHLFHLKFFIIVLLHLYFQESYQIPSTYK
jgi:hypothetical protein